MGDEIPAVRTPASPADQAAALVSVLQEKLGRAPLLSMAEMMLAQLCLENANGKGLWNNNPGNLTSNGSGTYYILKSLHTDNQGKPVPADDPSAVVLKFQAFMILRDGVAAYVAWVLRKKSLVDAASAGDADAYARAIVSSGYCPGLDTVAVGKSLRGEISSFRAAKIFEGFELSGPGASTVPPKAGGSMLLGIVAGLAAGGAYWFLQSKGLSRGS